MTRIGEVMAVISDGITKASAFVTAVSATITSVTTTVTDVSEQVRTTGQKLGSTGTMLQEQLSSMKKGTSPSTDESTDTDLESRPQMSGSPETIVVREMGTEPTT